MISSPNKLFLIDGLGALLTAFLLGVVLTTWEDCFGMPSKILYTLSIVALIYALYSISCYFLTIKNWKPYLRGIAIANLMYCCLTIGLVVYFYHNLTGIGVLYFLLEVAVILILIGVELRVSSRITK
ncbi:hypothetical protein [Aquimarina sp. 2304DJ70-9]|uniref:hypothetical protein n=1 Tax=Aquimarina penaris TaxID=3231044 RepID=UPI0034627231